MRTSAVVLGAGQAGLAVSWWLARRGIEHVVLERGDRVANTWRKERWPSLTLLTPNWQSRLPGYAYTGAQPDGFRNLDQTIGFLEDYARLVAPPLRLNSPVTALRAAAEGYELATPEGIWHCRAVVLATGAFNLPQVPALASSLPAGIAQLTPEQFRGPAGLPEGGVLVVGAAATGAQFADELARAGREVTLSVGEHVRAARSYRGRDLQWWMDAAGLNDETHEQVENLARARSLPSFQLTGAVDRRDVDLNALRRLGVRLVGRLAGVRDDGRLQLSGSLRNVCDLADLKLNRLLDTFDAWATNQGLDSLLEPVQRPAPTRVDEAPPLGLDLARQGIRSVVWATGYRPDYRWLHLPVLDAKGRLKHDGGVVRESPGLYALGLPFLRRRKSTLIDGVGDDARELSAHLAAFLGARHPASTSAPLAA